MLRQASSGFASFHRLYPSVVSDRNGAAAADAVDTMDGPVVDLQAPPMGFMSWERFMCEIDCEDHPHECINEELYTTMADAMVAGGYVEAGYNGVDIDDCWAVKDGRDTETQRLVPDPERFPNGMKFLADYLHARGMLFGTYSDVGTHTCGGYPGSKDHEAIDAQTFADWGVDYLKLDGCYIELDGMPKYYAKWGNELKHIAEEQRIVFSCSWPAYLGDDETTKPFAQMYRAGCNTWRNWADIDNTSNSLKGIIMHWARYAETLRKNQPNGAFHDADMLLVGDDHHGKRLSVEQARLQMGFWALVASPLFIGGDVRTIPDEYAQILLNHDIIAINQDPGRRMGKCLSGCHGNRVEEQQVWHRELNGNSSIALGFFNLNDDEIASVASVRFSLNKKIIKCFDLWAPGGTLINLCPSGSGQMKTKDAPWEINIGYDAKGSQSVQVTAHDMPPMTHHMLRLDLVPQ